MKLLLCGAGALARELLRQLGDDWDVTLMDKSEAELARTADACPTVRGLHAEDASSPVALENAGLAEADYVAALTGDMRVNAAVAEFALESGVPHVVTMVGDHEAAARLSEAGAYTLRAAKLLASQVYHYLQDPRIRVTPLHLTPGTVMEVKASEYMRVVGKRAYYFHRDNARLAALRRNGELVFPDPETVIQADDVLVILGDPSVFHSVCTVLECSNPHFPLSYGPGMLLVAGAEAAQAPGIPPSFEEALYLARHTQVKNITLLNLDPDRDYEEHLATWPQVRVAEHKAAGGDAAAEVRALCENGNYGLVLIPPFEEPYLLPMSAPTYVRLSHDIRRPLLISRATAPVERILVPFNGSAMSELSLEVGVDVARQISAAITVVLVEEPDFLTGESGSDWEEAVMDRLRQLRHIHKMDFETVLRRGNPIKQITAMTDGFDLMIVGGANAHRTLLTPNVAESLARKAACSVLIMAL